MKTPNATGRVHVGRASLEGSIQRYARSFDLLEVVAEVGRHPRRAGLVQWRKTVGAQFAFSVVLPHGLASLEAGPHTQKSLEHARQVAEALEASWWVLRTPPSVTPGARSLRLLKELLEQVRVGPRRVAWEPRGPWSDETALAAAKELGVELVRDLAREDRLDDAPIVYTRLRALGEGAKVGAAAAERVAERLEDVEEAYVVVEGVGAGRVRQVLREAAGVAVDKAPETDDDDEADEETAVAGADSDDSDDADEDADADSEDEDGDSDEDTEQDGGELDDEDEEDES